MNYVEDDEEIVDAAAIADEVAPAPPLPLKPWEHYTIADRLLREARLDLKLANELGAKLSERARRDPLQTWIDEAHGNGPGGLAASRLSRAQALAALAQAHSAQASAGALLQQHYMARFSELWSPGSVASTSKEERDAELDAWPGTATPPAS